MSLTLNVVMLQGNLGKDPEIKTFENGGKVANLVLATSEGGYTTKEGKEIPEVTHWHNIVCRSSVDAIEMFLHKGDNVTVVGQLKYRSYEANGEKKYVTEVVADKIVWRSNANTEEKVASSPTLAKTPNEGGNKGSSNGDLPF